ncbi:MAG: ribosomal protein L7/L12 [Akkermansia sp.]|nr:ribosomal protein L7/L12 [Akkermansia sp.]
MKALSIGIDFGTTKTLVSHINPQTGMPETLRLGRGRDYIPTSAYVDADGQISFGDDADEMLEDLRGRYLRGFKMNLGSSTPLHMYLEGGQPRLLTAKELVKAYLRFIRQLVQERVYLGEEITAATITRPVNFSPAQCLELEQAAKEAGFDSVKFTTEPEAAGLAFCRMNAAQAFKHSALIVDWGGGTLDFALVTRKGDAISTHSNLTDGDTTMGGETFDEKLWNYTEKTLKEQGVERLNVTTQLPKVRRAKEQLSTKDNVTLRLSYEGGTCPPLALSREIFNNLIVKEINEAVEKVLKLLGRIPNDQKPEMLLLVGGSSTIPLIKEKLVTHCQLPAHSWHYSREAVAMGAALWEQSITNGKEDGCSIVLKHPGGTPFALIRALPSLISSINLEQAMEMMEKLPVTLVEGVSAAKAEELSKALCKLGADVEIVSSGMGHNSKRSDSASFNSIAEVDNSGSIPTTSDLIQAIHQKNANLLKKMLRQGADANGLYKIGQSPHESVTPLVEAIRTQSLPCVKVLLENEADPNQVIPVGTTALHEAVENKNIDCVRVLLSAGANMEAMRSDDTYYPAGTVLHTAIYHNQPEIVQLLLQSGAKLQTVCHVTKDSPLSLAARKLNYECVRQLLEAKADTSHCNFIKNTPLHEALWGYTPEKHHSCFSCVKLLIEHGCNINAANEDGDTPLIIALQRKAYALVPILLEAGADATLRNFENKAPYHYLPALQGVSQVDTLALIDEIVNFSRNEFLSFVDILRNRQRIKLKYDEDILEKTQSYTSQIFRESQLALHTIGENVLELLTKKGGDSRFINVYRVHFSRGKISNLLTPLKKLQKSLKKMVEDSCSGGFAGKLIGGLAATVMLAANGGNGGLGVINSGANLGGMIQKKITNSGTTKQLNEELDDCIDAIITEQERSFPLYFASIPLLAMLESDESQEEDNYEELRDAIAANELGTVYELLKMGVPSSVLKQMLEYATSETMEKLILKYI